MERWHSTLMGFIIGIFVMISMYVFAHLLVLHGAVKERENKECVGAVAIQSWEGTLEVAREVCVESRDQYRDDIKDIYESQIKKLEDEKKEAEKERDDWKDSYFWLKDQPCNN